MIANERKEDSCAQEDPVYPTKVLVMLIKLNQMLFLSKGKLIYLLYPYREVHFVPCRREIDREINAENKTLTLEEFGYGKGFRRRKLIFMPVNFSWKFSVGIQETSS